MEAFDIFYYYFNIYIYYNIYTSLHLKLVYGAFFFILMGIFLNISA